MNRPKQLNTWTAELQQGIFDGMDSFGKDPDIRVIIITGNGRGFCAGAAIGAGGPNSTGPGRDGLFCLAERHHRFGGALCAYNFLYVQVSFLILKIVCCRMQHAFPSLS